MFADVEEGEGDEEESGDLGAEWRFEEFAAIVERSFHGGSLAKECDLTQC